MKVYAFQPPNSIRRSRPREQRPQPSLKDCAPYRQAVRFVLLRSLQREGRVTLDAKTARHLGAPLLSLSHAAGQLVDENRVTVSETPAGALIVLKQPEAAGVVS